MPEIYDLREDPREMYNLFGTDKGKELFEHLKSELESLKRKYHII